mgnify:CR=1 FL=1
MNKNFNEIASQTSFTGNNKKINAIIPAGGTSSRFGNKNKLLEKINGKEVIKYTVDAFMNSEVDEIIICANITNKCNYRRSKIIYPTKIKIFGNIYWQNVLYTV